MSLKIIKSEPCNICQRQIIYLFDDYDSITYIIHTNNNNVCSKHPEFTIINDIGQIIEKTNLTLDDVLTFLKQNLNNKDYNILHDELKKINKENC